MATKKQARKSKQEALSAQQLEEMAQRTAIAEDALVAAQTTTDRYFEGAQLLISHSDCPTVRKRLQEKLDDLKLAFVEVLAERQMRGRSARRVGARPELCMPYSTVEL